MSGELDSHDVVECYHTARKLYPDAHIGINFLDSPRMTIALLPDDANSLWTDYGIGYRKQLQQSSSIRNGVNRRNWKGIVFGGYWFKGNNINFHSDDDILRKDAVEAEKYFDVLMTSGDGTEIEIAVDRLKKIKSVTTKPLALASGVNSTNVGAYLPYVDYFYCGDRY